MWMCCGGTALFIGVALPRALWAVPASAIPQILEGPAPEAAPGLEAVAEQEKLPALLQLRLDLNPRSKQTVSSRPR